MLCINRDGSNIADKPNTVLMLGHRLRRWPNIKLALHGHLLFAWHPALTFVGVSCGHPEVVDRGSETQLQVGENYNYSVKLNDLDLLCFHRAG